VVLSFRYSIPYETNEEALTEAINLSQNKNPGNPLEIADSYKFYRVMEFSASTIGDDHDSNDRTLAEQISSQKKAKRPTTIRKSKVRLERVVYNDKMPRPANAARLKRDIVDVTRSVYAVRYLLKVGCSPTVRFKKGHFGQ
jgi:hypothetical protein